MKKLFILIVITCMHVSLIAQEKEILGVEAVVQAKTVNTAEAALLSGKAYALKVLVGTPLSKDGNNLPLDQFGVIEVCAASGIHQPMTTSINEDPLSTSFWLGFGSTESKPIALMIPGTEHLPAVRLSKINTL